MLSDRSWTVYLRKKNGEWAVVSKADDGTLAKRHGLQGPIDDAFLDRFVMVRPTGQPLHDKENAEVLVHSALGRARMEVAGGGLQTQAWYGRIDEAAREQHRGMGRKLLGLMLHYLNAAADPAQAGRILTEAAHLGSEYGHAALREGLTLGDAMRAFLYFRDSLLESVVQLRGIAGGAEMDSLASFRLVNTFTNELLVSMVAAFQES